MGFALLFIFVLVPVIIAGTATFWRMVTVFIGKDTEIWYPVTPFWESMSQMVRYYSPKHITEPIEKDSEQFLIEQRKNELENWDASFEKETGKPPFPPKRNYIDRSLLNKKESKKEQKERIDAEIQMAINQYDQSKKKYHNVRKLWG